MKPFLAGALSTLALLLLLAATQPEGQIFSTDFGDFPPGASLTGTEITLDGDAAVTGGLDVNGLVATTQGIRFPDGSVQTSAATAVSAAAAGSLTANAGLYDKRIRDFIPPLAYTEVCFVGGAILADIHTMGESPVGGNCGPGDVGWIIERNERSNAAWSVARADCLLDGMRLPEPFEFQLSCIEAGNLGLNDMTGAFEWASNGASPTMRDAGVPQRVAIPIIGSPGCESGAAGSIANNVEGMTTPFGYRCLL